MFILNSFLLFLLGFIFIIVFKNNIEDSYIRFGPSKKLNIMSFDIDTWDKWILTVFILSIIEMMDVLISETAINLIYNDIYNPSVTEIINFSNESQLQVYTQIMYGINSLRYLLMIKISVTQVDFAIINVIVGRLISIKTIHMNLSGKKYKSNTNVILL
jgi:hypothetical protein